MMCVGVPFPFKIIHVLFTALKGLHAFKNAGATVGAAAAIRIIYLTYFVYDDDLMTIYNCTFSLFKTPVQFTFG